MTKIGIALGGGGIVGCAHLGILLALEEARIPIHCLAGTSSGSIVAALYGFGYSARELIEFVPSIDRSYLDYDYGQFLNKLFRKDAQTRGLVRGKKLFELIAEKTGDARMVDLKNPVAILSADLRRGRQALFASRPLLHPLPDSDVFSDISVARAVQASCAVPLLFQPVEYKNHLFVDGGILENCPASAARALGADIVLAVDLVFADPVDAPFHSFMSILYRVITINVASQSKRTAQHADLVLRPHVGGIGMFDFNQAEHCMERGYDHAKERLDEIFDILDRVDRACHRKAPSSMTHLLTGKPFASFRSRQRLASTTSSFFSKIRQ
ncbi:hypothetical protein GTO89_09145 [Heliobacterium gestii]|uniref:PNPLA domain-containing protein n=1 Tax=Heliomicrobium gestii TaxID=2699 RepID=A0A845L984_HELGE|nr:patatin-like phospholipase family protein [Heliomicrobium gestii]MBM7866517.1 NTE family protein [Heliomicrobium gestii]MZP43202.1 hypothetical protein [Heliomicrobium gestii]